MNSTSSDLIDCIERGMEHMSRSFDRDLEGLPWFDIRLLKGKPAYMEHYPCFDGAHVPGRCLNGLLLGESVTGTRAADEVIGIYRKFLFESYDAEDGLNGFIDPDTNRRTIVFHNFREGLLALHALINWRNDAEARKIGDRMLEVIESISGEDGEWLEEKLAALREKVDLSYADIPTGTSGRLVGPLVMYYELTGNERSLKLAKRFADHALRTCFNEDGTLAPRAGGHVHSITSTISSLAEYYWFVRDLQSLDHVKRIYDHGITPWRSTFGWVKELIDFEHMGGEGNSTGDLIQSALIFAKAGYAHMYEDAEKMLRGHLIPSQVKDEHQIDSAWVVQMDQPTEDKWKDITYRIRGGFGFPTPNDRAPIHYNNDYIRITTLDITGGSVQSLCKAYNEAIIEEEATIKINLLFNRSEDTFKFAQLDIANGTYLIEGDGSKSIQIRIPSGTIHELIRVDYSFEGHQSSLSDGYILIQPQGPFSAILVMPCHYEEREEILLGHRYLTGWYGEQLVSMEPAGTISPMFQYQHSSS